MVLADSIKAMKHMEAGSVDLIFADEPYNLGKNFGKGRDSWKSIDEYIKWNKIWIDEAMKVLKFDGTMYMITHSKKSKITFNSSDILVEAKTGAKRKLIDYRKKPPRPYNTKKVPGNVWNFSRVRFRMSEYENHPTQKPEALLERIIKASSNNGDTIFDPFGGSFTTGAVAKN